ncbi:hypothetical protein GQ44DRAFT_779825 [Phaeosphaeriaceae sp. PMI808]|nr:hypothetical protein GQ44DRAFT_779825 [Phaeosphaeriaceae sp. PMI808]
MHPTFIFSLLATAVSAQSLSFPGTPADSTLEPPRTTTTSIQIPASLSFNASKAPAFTGGSGVPNISNGPVYSSTPCSTQITATPQVPSGGQGIPIKPSSPALPPQTPPIREDESEDLPPCEEDDEPEVADAPFSAAYPNAPAAPISKFPPFSTGSAPAFPIGAPLPTGGRPPFPIGSGRYSFRWGRPRPSGSWPSRGVARPTSGLHPHPPRSSGGFPNQGPSYGLSKGAAAPTPCSTFETRIRPTTTEPAAV